MPVPEELEWDAATVASSAMPMLVGEVRWAIVSSGTS